MRLYGPGVTFPTRDPEPPKEHRNGEGNIVGIHTDVPVSVVEDARLGIPDALAGRIPVDTSAVCVFLDGRTNLRFRH